MPISSKRPIKVIFHPSDFTEGSEVAFAHALKIALIARAELDILHVSERDQEGWSEFPGVRQMLERWRVLPPNSPKNAVAAVGLGVRKVVMKGKDPIHAAQHFLEENPTDFVVLAAHTHQWAHALGPREGDVATDRQRLEAAALFVPYGSEGFVSRADGNPSLKNVLIPVDSIAEPGGGDRGRAATHLGTPVSGDHIHAAARRRDRGNALRQNRGAGRLDLAEADQERRGCGNDPLRGQRDPVPTSSS